MMTRKTMLLITLLTLVMALVSACGSEARRGVNPILGNGVTRELGVAFDAEERAEPANSELPEAGVSKGQQALASDSTDTSEADAPQAAEQTVQFTLETTMEHGMAFKGVGGEIDGVINPELKVPAGAEVEITLVNGDGVQHDLMIDAFGVATAQFMEKGTSETITFIADQDGTFEYICSVPGHKQAGMVGKLIVEGEATAAAASTPSETKVEAAPVTHAAAVEGAPVIAADPNDVPAPIGERAPRTVQVELETIELVGELADGTTYEYWTFNGIVPGPMLRVRVGDTVELSMKNREDSAFAHSIDLHAVTGHHGGGSITQAAPGEEKVFTFQALNPGVYVYHCATPMVPHHIANGMYGLIVVEPEGGLPPVDREFYVMQGELYTTGRPGDTGHLDFDVDAMLDEKPNYLVFNGSTEALTEELAMRAEVGETVRIYMGVGGPNLTSGFHVIGEIFDRVYDQASITSPPLTDVQTTVVPPGGATVVEFTVDHPGTYVLVDHALGRLVKGLKAYLIVEGEPNPDIIHEGPAQ
ncbi:MAG: copper-containing nitrite reductase [Chloroflexota bacterium]|nr:copper-containing nitrite reductase [Chloroflexota bacterium]